jgi:hypothetical protein
MIGESFTGSKLLSLAATSQKVQAVAMVSVFALDLKIDAQVATVIVAFFVAVSSMWNSWTLTKVHKLVNSNFTEAKLAHVAAEESLKISQAVIAQLERQIATLSANRPEATLATSTAPVPVEVVNQPIVVQQKKP